MITAKNRIKAVLSLLLAGVMASQTAMSAFAESGISESNTEVEHIVLVEEEPSEYGETDCHFEDEYGNIVEFDLSVAQYDDYGTLPSSYDLRDYGVVTSVKSQGSTGTCWAHSAIAAAESNLVYKGLATSDVDLSEGHLVWFTEGQYVSDANDPLYRDFVTSCKGATAAYNPGGGNIYKARSALNAGMGAALESDYAIVTDAPVIDESKRYDSSYFLEGCKEYDVTDRDTIKSALMNNGALTISYYYAEAYENVTAEGGTAFYNNVNTNTNHAVTLVGWDDDYSASNFAATPAGNGAWLCKNSWNTWYGDNGYFWLSYYDTSIARINLLEMAKSDKYSHIYQYSGSYTGSLRMSNYTICGANIFTAVNDDPITAVAFQTSDPNASCDIHIFTGVDGTPTSGTKVLTKSVQLTNAGLYTIALDEPVNVTEGTKFSVVVALTSSGKVGICLDDNSNSAGHSFYCTGDPLKANWTDTYTYYENDVHVKALTSSTVKAVAPANVKATVEDGKVTLAWDAVTGATKYRIRRNDGSGWVDYKDVTATSFIDTEVTEDSTYQYSVYSYVNGEWSAASDIVSVKVPAAGLDGYDANLTYDVLTGVLSWDPYTGDVPDGEELKYRLLFNGYSSSYVHGSTDSDNRISVYHLPTLVAAEGLLYGRNYSGDVEVSLLVYSESADYTTTDITVSSDSVIYTFNGGNQRSYIESPADVRVTDYYGSGCFITWTKIDDPNGFVFNAMGVSSGWGLTMTFDGMLENYDWGIIKSFVDNGYDTDYIINIYTIDNNGDYSAPTTCKFSDLFKVEDLKATAGDGKVELTWSEISGAEKYKIRRYDGTSWSDYAEVENAGYTDTDLINGKTYKYAVYTFNGGAWSPASVTVSATPVDTNIAAPENVKATAVVGKITLTWDAVAGATKYKIRRHNGTSWSDYKEVSTNSFTDTAVTAGTTYKYAVYAYGSKWSAASAIVSVKAAAATVSAPANVKATAVVGKITLTWDAVTGATKYKVRRHNGTSWSDYATATTNSFEDTAVTAEKTYKYAVYAYANGKWSGASATVSAVAKAAAPTNVKATATSGKITLTWGAVADATKYKVRRHDGTSWADYTETTETSFVDAAVTACTTYKYAVYAYVSGKWSAASVIVSAAAL